jgi:hypothetical protein
MRRSEYQMSPPLLAILLVLVSVPPTYAGAPTLYGQTAHESPVHANADDLLFLAGIGLGKDDRVVYEADFSPGHTKDHPSEPPLRSTSRTGVATVVSAAGAPYQLTVRMPDTLASGRPYYIWVRNASLEWSNGIRINDPRPLWASPSEVSSTAVMPGFATRYLKLIGRNLLLANAASLGVRLSGPAIYALKEADRRDDDRELLKYVTKRRLPGYLAPGEYQVEVQDGDSHWTPVHGQVLRVVPDQKKAPEFGIEEARFGGCRADDDLDDTGCLINALAAARNAGGGMVLIHQGTWNIAPGTAVVPANVGVHGEGMHITKVKRLDLPGMAPDSALLTLLGYNVISGISFSDQHVFKPQDTARPILQLGRRLADRGSLAESAISHVIITGNEFDKTFGAIVDSGSSLSNLVITDNHFGDYHLALDLGGNRFDVESHFHIDDAVITGNSFAPGSYIDRAINQGAMASQLGASTRVDFSSNIADGSTRHYLYTAADPSGWRAGFFWHMNNNHEMLLISDNQVNCSGDKAGDGEAIALDNNANTFALPGTGTVIGSTKESVTVAGPLIALQSGHAIDVDHYYSEHWIRIDDGPGIGQSRKILSYRIDHANSEATFTVTPSWDVPPDPNASTVSVTRQFWQTLIVANRIDQRTPLCRKANSTRPKGGVITVWGQSTDSVVDGNRQFDSDGILFQQAYTAEDSSCPSCRASETMPAFLAIENNSIDGEYDWNSACSLSGIMGSFGASPTPNSPPPPLSFAVSISHNRITHADGLYGGAISIGATWFEGPPLHTRPLVAGIAVDHNDISHISGVGAATACGYKQRSRIGIHLRDGRHQDSTVLYMNSCNDVSRPLVDEAARTQRVCDRSPGVASCECGSAQ